MFERFTRSARLAVRGAVREAELASAERVGAEHLLLALLAEGTRSAPVLAAAGLTRDGLAAGFAAAGRRAGLTEAEAEALGELGIDVDAVVERVERAHGENALADRTPRRLRLLGGHRPFTEEAKALLAAALVQARELNDRHIGDEHLLLAMSADRGVAAQVLTGHGLSHAELRARLAGAA